MREQGRQFTTEQAPDKPPRFIRHTGAALDYRGVEEAAAVLGGGDGLFGEQARQQALDRRQRPIAVALAQRLVNVGRGERLTSRPQHFHHVPLGFAKAFFHDSSPR